MSDQYVTTTIWGRTDWAGLNEIAEAMSEDGVGFDWGENVGFHEKAETVDLIAGFDLDEGLTVYDDTSKNGRMNAVEETCASLGLTYVRVGQASDGDDATVTWKTPSMAEPRTLPSDSEGRPIVTVCAIDAALEEPDPLTALRAMIADLRVPQPEPLLIA